MTRPRIDLFCLQLCSLSPVVQNFRRQTTQYQKLCLRQIYLASCKIDGSLGQACLGSAEGVSASVTPCHAITLKAQGRPSVFALCQTGSFFLQGQLLPSDL